MSQKRVDGDQVAETKFDGKKSGLCSFDEDVARKDLCRMIILHEYPLSMVDHIEFKKYSNTLQPLFKVPSRRTISRDIIALHDIFKKKVVNILDGNEGRIAITTDMWTSDHHKKGYMAVTAHFIDNNWTTQKRIIRFEYDSAPHLRQVMVKHLMACLLDWNIDRKLSTITVDNCSVNDGVVVDLVNKISKEKFEELAHQLKIPRATKLIIDGKTRWNSTYLMHACAINYKKVFERCEKTEVGFRVAISDSEWDRAALLCDKLKLFYLVTKKFSGTKYPTAKLYFPSICKIKLALRGWAVDSNDLISGMAKMMLEKYEKYWKDVQGIIGVATLLDPRYKKILLRYYFEKLFEQERVYEELEKIVAIFNNMLQEYEKNVFESRVAISSVRVVDEEDLLDNVPMDYDNYAVMSRRGRSGGRSELEHFLDSDVVPREDKFDILSWWKVNGPTFPILQKIDRDIYAIPVSTIASESAFSTGGRLVSPHRNRLNPTMVEALACTQNWLQAENTVLLEKLLSSPQIFLEDIEEGDDTNDGENDDLNMTLV